MNPSTSSGLKTKKAPSRRGGQARRSRQASEQASLGQIILQKLTVLEELLQKNHDKPLTFREACAYLGYAPSYLYKLTYKKLIPHYKPTGKMIFFSKNELDQWIYKNGKKKTRDGRREDVSSALSIFDPNQVEMFEHEIKEKVEGVIEFPMKSKRRKGL
jgi:excisionase family DNA binding protein